MEDQIYQTDSDYNYDQICEVEQWFERNIGTELERTEVEPDIFYLMAFNMTKREVNKSRIFELQYRESKGL